MEALGFGAILVGILLLRQVFTGRVKEAPDDLRDLTLAIFSGDFNAVGDVSKRRGVGISDSIGGGIAGGTIDVPRDDGSGAPSSLGTSALAEMRRLGSVAKGYRYAATGPDYYDCSGLVWRALNNLGIWKGVRFSSGMFPLIVGPQLGNRVDVPIVGDIVVWPGRHIGMVSGNGLMYSALNSHRGIVESSIATGVPGVTPQYWRLTK